MTPWLDDGDVRLYAGDALETLREMPSESVQCIVTSPPFFALRDYGVEGQMGLEGTVDEWCDALVAVFREARRVLRSDGVMWLEVGDSYANVSGGVVSAPDATKNQASPRMRDMSRFAGMKTKDLCGAPWLLAFALRADGWYLRSDTIWARPNPMPESVTDRPTKAHSYVFLLTKSARYFMDMDAIREPHSRDWHAETVGPGYMTPQDGRNARSVWSIATEPTPFAHFATFPQALVERCIKAGSAEGDLILDPFMGSGTTALVARRLGRHAVGIELNAEYLSIAATRLQQLSLLGGTA